MNPLLNRLDLSKLASPNGGTELSPQERWHIREFIANQVTSRQEFIKQYLDPRRSINEECGYPETTSITVDQYQGLFDRESIAARVVEVLPAETWKFPPTVFEDEDSDVVTPFEQAWDQLGRGLRGKSFYQDEEGNPIWEYLRRVDILSGIGHFGVLLLGIDDGKRLDQPVDGVEEKVNERLSGMPSLSSQEGTDAQYHDFYFSAPTYSLNEEDPSEKKPTEKKPDESNKVEPEEKAVEDNPQKEVKTKRRLLFVRPYQESLVQITRYETNPQSPRFGQPVEYSITLNSPTDNHGGIGLSLATIKVHWTRIIHVADNLNSSEIFGVPRQRPVFNRLLDLQKLYGGSAEMYWRGAFPGLSFESHPQLAGDIAIDTASVKDAAERYMNSLQRYLVSEGMTVKSIAPQVVDPTPQIDGQIQSICIKLGIPQRIFMGSERGELASGQDDATWNDRLRDRQTSYVTPRLIIPFVDRLILMEVLPEPSGYSITWPDLDAIDEDTKAGIAQKKTAALAQYVSGGVDALIPPMDYLTRILDMDEEEATAILENSVDRMNDEDVSTDPLKAKQEQDRQIEQEKMQAQFDQEKELGKQRFGNKPGDKKPPTNNQINLLTNLYETEEDPVLKRWWKKKLREVTANSTCGAGEEGDAGFQPGNTCAKGGGGGRAEAVKREIQDAASRIQFSDEAFTEPVDVSDLDPADILKEMNWQEMNEMDEYLTERGQEMASEWIDEKVQEFEPQLDMDWVHEEAGYSANEIYDAIKGKIKDFVGSDEEAQESLMYELDKWFNDRPASGQFGIEQARDSLSVPDEYYDLIEAIEDYREGAADDIQREIDAQTEIARRDYEIELLNDHVDSFIDDDMREEYLRQWAEDNPHRFASKDSIELGVWQKEKGASSDVFHFKSSNGATYQILADPSTARYVPQDHEGVKPKAVTISFANEDEASNRYGVTGSGKAHEVFSNVIAATVAYVNKHDTDLVVFTAAEKSRQRLYDRLVKGTASVLGDRWAAAVQQDEHLRLYVVGKREFKEPVMKRLEEISETLSKQDSERAPIVPDMLINRRFSLGGNDWPSWWEAPAVVANKAKSTRATIWNRLGRLLGVVR